MLENRKKIGKIIRKPFKSSTLRRNSRLFTGILGQIAKFNKWLF